MQLRINPQYKPRKLVLAIALLFASPAFAGQTEKERIAELEKKLERSLAVIETLSSRVEQLEAKNKSAEAPKQVIAALDSAVKEKVDEAQKVQVKTSEEHLARIDQLEKILYNSRTPVRKNVS